MELSSASLPPPRKASLTEQGSTTTLVPAGIRRTTSKQSALDLMTLAAQAQAQQSLSPRRNSRDEDSSSGGSPVPSPSSLKARSGSIALTGSLELPRAATSTGVTVLIAVAEVVFLGFASGELRVISLSKGYVASCTLPQFISCACNVGGDSVWLGVGNSIYEARFVNDELIAEERVSLAHGADFVASCVYTSRGQVWSATARGDVCVWDAMSANKIQHFYIGTRLHCMCAVEMQGVETVWMGCDDVVRVFSSAHFSLLCVLPLTRTSEVTCMRHVSVDVVWIGVRNRGDKGSLYVWDFSL